ncbi:sensor domain-containing diguanylate cyclase [Vibrio hannami]|uniref:sensor domain-containing diguanylate cyclase n=1 Tax=Vibrio hannami TaxID=2717094 RepID=UPI00240EFB98|nr:sensor domain-containing diguanylate cyclase [Vibrio hannami]MDG3085770.1 sensor domain-containing diguanylate cyclase [Vibrio hannami]
MDQDTEIGRFLDFLADAILIVDEKSHIIYVNQSCSQMFGYDKPTFLTMKLEQLMQSDAAKNHHQKVAGFIDNQSSAKVMMSRNIMPCVNADGIDFNARISIANIEYEGKHCAIATIQDYSTIQNMIDNLSNEASTDVLTGLFNKRHLESLYDQRYFENTGSVSYGVAYLDLNGFKAINDTHGHEVGDEVLREVATRMSHGLRAGDLSFRIGGDEFLLLFSITNPKAYKRELGNFGHKIHNLISKPISIDSLDLELNVGTSIGLGAYPFDGEDMQEIIQKADKAMYHSKANCIPFVLVPSDE